MATQYPTTQSRLVDVSAEFFDGSFFNVGTIAISPFVAGEELDLTGTIARIKVSASGAFSFEVDSDTPEADGVLIYDPTEATLEVKIPTSLNSLLSFGKNSVVIWIVFAPGDEDEEPEELARGVWVRNKVA